MSQRELERFARDMHTEDHVYRAALLAGLRCRTMPELEAFLLGLGYDVRAADLRTAGALAPVLEGGGAAQ
ncbi:hypothetical protein C882_0975 [Caenispirillum salinarum AK4]|uniref:Nif11 domain-containing protein n=1 Tax=Caenispirillum salinarum AK4 TaxID=1238182 RepID=K9HIF6_9PROT|nr:hypothetical protein [Caenispirillum salinarum]EKV28401.1 hypothetical protein C882_0975 [Caenispirillum salinarum AK4]